MSIGKNSRLGVGLETKPLQFNIVGILPNFFQCLPLLSSSVPTLHATSLTFVTNIYHALSNAITKTRS